MQKEYYLKLLARSESWDEFLILRGKSEAIAYSISNIKTLIEEQNNE